MFEKFTDRARKAMDSARRFAGEWNAEFVGTEHILLAIADQTSGVGVKILRRLGVSQKELRQAVENMLRQATGPKVTIGQAPFTPRVRKVFDLAAEEAWRMDSTWIDTSHLLLGLYKEEEGIASKALRTFEKSHGINLGRLRAEAAAIVSSTVEADGTDSEKPGVGSLFVVMIYQEFEKGKTGVPVLVANGVHYRAVGRVTLSGVENDKVHGMAAALAKEQGASVYRVFEGTDAE